MAMFVQGVDLNDVHEELKLHEMLDSSEDYEDRKKIRARLKDVIAFNRAQREEMIRRREEEREDMIRNRLKAADQNKQRTLQMYDAMAKSAPAGGRKVMDINILKEGKSSPGSTPQSLYPPPVAVDLVEEAIRARQREADANKKKVLAAFDQAARSGPAGAPRFVDFDNVNAQQAKPLSPKEKFQQLDSANAPKGVAKSPTSPVQKTNVNIMRSPTAIKEMIINWCKSKTKGYEGVSIDNFSGSWSDGLAFCALIHHFYPDAFDFTTLSPKNRRFNFDLAFRVAEEQADIAPLLDTDDMVMMAKPDWKCVFTYVQSIYRRLYNADK